MGIFKKLHFLWEAQFMQVSTLVKKLEWKKKKCFTLLLAGKMKSIVLFLHALIFRKNKCYMKAAVSPHFLVKSEIVPVRAM